MRDEILNLYPHLHKKQFKPVLASLAGGKGEVYGFACDIIKIAETVRMQLQRRHCAQSFSHSFDGGPGEEWLAPYLVSNGYIRPAVHTLEMADQIY